MESLALQNLPKGTSYQKQKENSNIWPSQKEKIGASRELHEASKKKEHV